MRRYWAVTVGIALGTAFIPYFGSNYEYLFAPVYRDSVVNDVELEDDGDLCWTWSFVKVRHARPLGFHYFVSSTNLDDTPVVFRRREVPVTTIERPLGPASDRYCVRLPRGLAAGARLRASGQAFYTVPHGLWVIRQPMPTVTYP